MQVSTSTGSRERERERESEDNGERERERERDDKKEKKRMEEKEVVLQGVFFLFFLKNREGNYGNFKQGGKKKGKNPSSPHKRKGMLNLV